MKRFLLCFIFEKKYLEGKSPSAAHLIFALLYQPLALIISYCLSSAFARRRSTERAPCESELDSSSPCRRATSLLSWSSFCLRSTATRLPSSRSSLLVSSKDLRSLEIPPLFSSRR